MIAATTAIVAVVSAIAIGGFIVLMLALGHGIGGEGLARALTALAAIIGVLFPVLLVSMYVGRGPVRGRGTEAGAGVGASASAGPRSEDGYARWTPPPRRRRSLPGLLCLGLVMMAGVPTVGTVLYYTEGGGELWEIVPYMPALWVAPAVTLAFMYRGEERLRRLEDATDRMLALGASVPRRTEAETLAALREMRTLCAEASAMAARLKGRGRDLEEVLGKAARKIDEAHDVQAGTHSSAEASAVDFARAMRPLGGEIDYASPRGRF